MILSAGRENSTLETRAVSGIMLILVLSGTLVLTFHIGPVEAEPRTWTVDDDGPADFSTIQQAIYAASPGDSIFVYSGTYYENVVVDRTVSLVGENKSTTIIDARRIGSVVVVTANDVGIQGFTTRGSSISLSSPQPGIGIRGSGAVITDNIVRDNYFGIFLQDSNNNSIIGNEVYSNYDLGIAVSGSNNNTLIDNNVASNRLGIHLSYSGNNTLIGNVMNSNTWNFGVWGGNDADFENDIDMSNLVNGKPIYYLKRVSNSIYDSSTNAGAFFLINSTNVTLRDLNLSRNIQNAFLWKTSNSRLENLTVPSTYDAGIALCYSDSITITGSKITDSYCGILLKGSNNSKVMDNYVYANWHYGIFLEYSSDCTVEGNVVTDNNTSAEGIEVNNSYNNTVFRNILSGNINGVVLRTGATENTIMRNIASYNNFGISVGADSFSNYIIDNDVTNNLYGIELGTFVSDNVVSGNVISSNSNYGIWLWGANNNLIFHNNILNNPTQVYNYDSANTWDDGYPSGGNYWSDYTGTDLYRGRRQDKAGSDGIGDTPYIILGLYGTPNDIDQYPLMNTYGMPRSYFLTIITASGGTTTPTSGMYEYTAGSSVEVAAVPDTNYIFEYWELDWINVGSANPITIPMNVHHRLRAVFRSLIHEIAITDVSPSKRIVGQGCLMQIDVTVENWGDFTETFNVIMYAQTTVIGILTVDNLFERTHTVLTCQWNTTGFAKGYYSISAHVDPVPGEMDTTDNTYVDGDITVAMIGDISGPTANIPDGEIDTRDMAILAAHYGDLPPDGHIQSAPEYTACFNCDITGSTAGVPDGKIDLRDLFVMAKEFGQLDP